MSLDGFTMSQYLIKIAISIIVIIAATELSKRSSWLGALLIALPLTSLLAMTWLYFDTGSVQQVANLSRSIFWLVLPSLALFLVFPWAIEHHWKYWPALALGCSASIACYGLLVLAMRGFGKTI
jgi:hypothetical protein